MYQGLRRLGAIVLGLAGCGEVMETPDAPIPVSTLTVSVSGTGTVTSAPDGIDCGAACTADFARGASVTLTATAASGHQFAGWSGAGCTGTSTCVLDVDADVTTTALFVPMPHLSVTVEGPGRVTSVPTGFECDAQCAIQAVPGTGVILNATADLGAVFLGWDGPTCSGPGTGSCVFNLTADTTVTAKFSSQFLVNQLNGARHIWRPDGTTTLFHTGAANDADCNAPQGSPAVWYVEHTNDQLGSFAYGAPSGGAAYTVGYAYPKHVAVFASAILVMSRNDATIHKYTPAGLEVGTPVAAPAGLPTGQGIATNGTDVFASYWDPTNQRSMFQRYDASLAPQGTPIANPTGLTENNVVDIVWDPSTNHFLGIATNGEGGTGTSSAKVVEFEMGGAVINSYTLPFAVSGIGQHDCP